jgi:hypothetical protein
LGRFNKVPPTAKESTNENRDCDYLKNLFEKRHDLSS